jgi:hypothetical protein
MVTVLIGGALTLVGFLIVPLFLVSGYVVRAIRANLDGEPEPPTFGDWGELLVDGLKATVIGFVYMLVPLIVMGLTVGGAIVAIATGSDAGAAAGFGGLMIGLLVSFVLSLLFGYLSSVAIVNFAREGTLGAGFDVGRIWSVGFDADFAIPWLLSVAVFIAAGVVTIVPLVGALIAVFTNFYAAIVAARRWADGFNESLDGGGSAGRTGLDETVA